MTARCGAPPSSVIRQLDQTLDRYPAGPLLVCVSGGLDSTVLLHALVYHAKARTRGLQVIHVDHALQAASARWASRVAEMVARWGVPALIENVVVTDCGEGLEAAARKARYAAIEKHLPAGGIALTAHHADDQAETVLLRLLRGAGGRGAWAMAPIRPFAQGWLARPFLDIPRAALLQYAEAQQLEWIEDPANADRDFDRNHLRHRVLPVLRERWPHAGKAMARSARLLREADSALCVWLDGLLAASRVSRATLSAEKLRALPEPAQRQLIRHWCGDNGVAPPGGKMTETIVRQTTAAAHDAQVVLRWRGGQIRKWRDMIFVASEFPEPPPSGWAMDWDGSHPLRLPASAGTLRFDPSPGQSYQVRFRKGGERIAVDPRRPSQQVKSMLQELGVPPWERAIAPFLWDGDELMAVGDWIFSARFEQYVRQSGSAYRWMRAGATSMLGSISY